MSEKNEDPSLIPGTTLKWSTLERDLQKSLRTECSFGDHGEASVMENGGGFASKIVFTKIDWNGENSENLPTKFVLKVTAGQELKTLASFGNKSGTEFDPAEICRLINNNELIFYRNAHSALRLPNDFPLPKFFGGHIKAAGAEDPVPGYILLDWVEGIEARYQYNSLDEFSVLQVLKSIAVMNAKTFDQPSLENVFPLNIRESMDGKFINSKNNGERLEKYLDRCPERKEQVEIFKNFSKIYDEPEKVQKLRAALSYNKKALTHGDLTQQNVFWRKNGNGNLDVVAIHDWQATHFGNPLADLARFLGIALSPDQLKENINHYLAFYFEKFNENLPEEIKNPWQDLEDFISCFEKMFCLVNTSLISILISFGPLVTRTAPDAEKSDRLKEFNEKVDAIADYLTKCIEKWFQRKE